MAGGTGVNNRIAVVIGTIGTMVDSDIVLWWFR